MTHEDALNKLLADACSNPAYYPDDGVTYEYEVRLCCSTMKVIAKPLGPHDGVFKYEIVEIKET